MLLGLSLYTSIIIIYYIQGVLVFQTFDFYRTVKSTTYFICWFIQQNIYQALMVLRMQQWRVKGNNSSSHLAYFLEDTDIKKKNI